MAIIFFQQRKKQKYLIAALILIILVILVIIWKGFLLKPKPGYPPSVGPEVLKPPKIEINFEVLKSPILEGFQPFEEIIPFEEEVGRENPFVPY